MIHSRDIQTTEELLRFIRLSPTAYQAVDQVKRLLLQEGFSEKTPESGLSEGAVNFFVSRNGSSLLAVKVPEGKISSILLVVSHSDSPTFKIKRNAEHAVGESVILNTEPYGGMIHYSWLDRPLSVAGRVTVQNGNRIETVLVTIDRDLLVIPSVCIHYNRKINEGAVFNPAVDLRPLYSLSGGRSLLSLVAESAGVNESSILGQDLFLYNRTPGVLFGAENEFFSSPRIDNLQCAFASLKGFLASDVRDCAAVWVMLDNEETGSLTKQGAWSDFVLRWIERIAKEKGEDLDSLLDSSLMLSADNGHAVHPNHPELSDPDNAPRLNGGVVVKYNASQKYATDAVSDGLFRAICQKNGIPLQTQFNRSDIPGGSTLGSILNSSLPVPTVDIGLAQLAMHSSYETAGSADTEAMIRACQAFFSTRLEKKPDGFFSID